jgi:hypothetical protein
MSHWKALGLAAMASAFLGAVSVAPAQVAISIGAPPLCPYGYYDYAPYNCSPYGYYGPDWFTGGVFIGAGPWFHGHPGWYGHVDNRYDPRHGYHGPYPERGERPFNHFHGNVGIDGHGHEGNPGHSPEGEHAGGFSGHGSPGGFHGGGGHH